MRMFHTAHRKKNPTRRSALTGEKKKLHQSLIRKLGRSQNPPSKRSVVDTFNLLGQIESFIEQEAAKASDTSLPSKSRKAARKRVRDFMALRDTVRAKAEGNLDPRALEYSLEEAIRGLTAAEVRVVQRMLAESSGDLSPEQGEKIRRQAALDPDVLRQKSRVAKAEQLEALSKKAFEAAIRRNKLGSGLEWQRGEIRHASIQDSEAETRKEIGDERFVPADKELWKRATAHIEKKYSSGYVPPSITSTKREELAMLAELEDRSTPSARRREIKMILERRMSARLRTKTILAYEKAGGRELSQSEKKAIKRRSAQRMQKLGEPFSLGHGFYGMVDEEGSGFVWALIDNKGKAHFVGKTPSKNAAAKNTGIAFRILESLVTMDESRVGWDELPERDRKWLESNYPSISEKVARLMLKNINQRVKVSRSTAQWLMKAGGISEMGKKESQMEKDCEGMTIGEERVFKGKGGAYFIHVKKGMRNKYTMYVSLKDGRVSQQRRLAGCDQALSRGHALGGAMIGGEEVAKAISNPAKLKQMNGKARRFFAKKNPDLPRDPAEVGDIKELIGMIDIPADNEEAFRYGYYSGIIRGIDTCGVQNYMKRKRIRKDFKNKLFESFMTKTKRAGGVKDRRRKREEDDEFNW